MMALPLLRTKENEKSRNESLMELPLTAVAMASSIHLGFAAPRLLEEGVPNKRLFLRQSGKVTTTLA